MPDLLEEWLAATTYKKKAELEAKIWESNTNRTGDKRTYLSTLLGGKLSEYEWRGALWSMGVIADPLWERIDNKKITPGAAYRLSRDAKKLAESFEALPEVLKDVLDQYEATPVSTYQDGVPIRRMGEKVPYTRRNSVAETEIEDDALEWRSQRDVLAVFIKAQMSRGELPEREKLQKELLIDIDVFLKTLQDRLYRYRARSKKYVDPALFLSKDAVRKEVEDACEVLLMAAPENLKDIDLKLANKQKHRLAQQYHPDANDGNTADVDKYQAVIEAYNTLEQVYREEH